MKIRHEVCLDHDRTQTKDRCAEILAACGHGPTLKMKAADATDTVHGSVSVAFCDTRTLGVDILEFRDGRREVATADNIAAWFQEQGHSLELIQGNKAYGNTIIDVEIYEADEGRKRKPATMPAIATIKSSINAAMPKGRKMK